MIFIASCSQDVGTVGPVIKELARRKIQTVVYNADQVAAGAQTMGCTQAADGTMLCKLGDLQFSMSAIAAAWYRRPNFFSMEEPDNVKLIYLNGQRQDVQMSLWRSIPKDRWLNAPDVMRATNDKCLQMQYAATAGLRIPRTIISNNWDEILNTLTGDEILLKLPYGILYEDDGSRYLGSTIVKRSEVRTLTATNPFPGLWQEYIPKKREWRVTVVGDKVFAAAIYTKSKARDDWRKHQFDGSSVLFKKEKLPAAVAGQCVAVLRQMGLGYGAFDLIETPSGDIIFLEVNANGQYQWLVDRLGLAIPVAIADELMARAG